MWLLVTKLKFCWRNQQWRTMFMTKLQNRDLVGAINQCAHQLRRRSKHQSLVRAVCQLGTALMTRLQNQSLVWWQIEDSKVKPIVRNNHWMWCLLPYVYAHCLVPYILAFLMLIFIWYCWKNKFLFKKKND